MKRHLPLALCFLFLAVTAVVAWQQYERAAQLESRLATLTAHLREKDSATQEQADLIARLKNENASYTTESSALRERLTAPGAPEAAPANVAAASTPPKKKGMSEFFGNMMKDPKMKEMMRQQQTAAMKQMYGDFVKARGLNAQQSEQFLKLLMETQMGAMEEGMTALNGDDPTASPAEPGAPSAAERKAEADRQLHMLLGEGGYAGYKDYEKSVGERMALTQVRQQLAANSIPLAEDQAKSLLQVMMEERARTPASPLDASAPGNPREKMRMLADSASTETFFQAQTELNQRILSRVGGILKPEQYSAFESFQKQQLEMQKFGLEMARKMMGDDKADPPQP